MKFIIDAILTGTWGITAALLILQLFRLKLQINPVIIKSISILVLLGASAYLLKTVTTFIYYSYSDGTYDRYTFKKYDFLVSLVASSLWLLNYGLLPQLLWIKKLRRLSSLVVLMCIWAITSLFTPWGSALQFLDNPTDSLLALGFKFEFSTLDYLGQAAVYAIAFAVVFSIISRRHNKDQFPTEEQLGVKGDIE